MIDTPISTERLTIRRFRPADIEGYLHFMLDDNSTRFLAFETEHKTEVGARALFDYVIANYDSEEVVHAYAIIDDSTGTYVGSCGFAPYEDGIVECYYCVNRDHRGRGIANEATSALVRALSRSVEVRAYCHSDNIAAHTVAKKCGMEHVGPGRNKNTGLDGELFVRRNKDR